MKKQGNLLMKLTDLVGLTFLWVIGCIPIVTIFTSTAAMYHTVVTCVRGGKAGITAGNSSDPFIRSCRRTSRSRKLFRVWGK